MRYLLRCTVLALVLFAGLPAAHAQTQPAPPPPLEDVTLRGRVLGADGAPVVNTPVRVDAIHDSGFAIVGFFFSLGFTTISCFTSDKELCPLPNSKRFNSATDANGRYSFTFRNAHRRGIQTDTDYVLSIGVPSRAAPGAFVVGSYELELKDAVHDAPDLRLWDPAVRITDAGRQYAAVYDVRPSSSNGANILFGDKPSGVSLRDNGTVDVRALEDQLFSVVPNASKDVTAAGTIYHQRFTAAPATHQGNLVPLSRNAACTATRADGSAAHCGYTDGDLVTPGVVDPAPCAVAQQTPCQSPVTKVRIDLGGVKDVSEVRARCTCELQASRDGQVWHNLPTSGTFGTQPMRYVAVTGASLGAVPEISVWPPWPSADRQPGLGSLKPPTGDSDRPWLLVLVAVFVLGVAGGLLVRKRNNVTEVGRPL